MTMRSRAIALAVVMLIARGAPLLAQGHHGVPPGQAKKVPPSSGSHPAHGDPSALVFGQPRALGSWLDDASVLTPRSAWMTISTNRWSSPAGRGSDAPVVDLVAGLTPRVQVAMTLPYSRFTDEAGETWNGVGDTYVGAKIMLRSSDRGLGVAVAPTLEWSSDTAAADRAHWVLPVNVELRRTNWRAYGSSGYFTRGAFFAAGAVERTITSRLTATGALTQSWSTGNRESAEAYGLARRRTDANGGAAWSVSPSLVVFASLSRTLSRLEYDSSRFAFNAGASVKLTAR